MTTVHVVLPDELAEEARRAGLLTEDRVETWLREQLRQQKSLDLLKAMDHMAAVVEEAGLIPEDVAQEIREMRAERRRSAA